MSSQYCGDSVKSLEWLPRRCSLRRFSASRFWQSLGNHYRVLFVGDSISAQQFENLRCWMEQGKSRFVT